MKAPLKTEMVNPEAKTTEGRLLTRFELRMQDDPNQLVVAGPPRNNEVEIIGIQYRQPTAKEKESNSVYSGAKFSYDNLNNYVLLIRMRKDENTIKESMPIDIRLNLINNHLMLFKPET